MVIDNSVGAPEAVFPKGFMVMSALWVALVISGTALTYCKYMSRDRIAQLQALYAERDELQVEWTQLMLEQSTWGALNRVEQYAVDVLGMHTPSAADMIIVSNYNRGHEYSARNDNRK